jgi:hypothetical protein
MAVHRTAQGKMVDMSRLASRNEKTRAVGNMNVNARGDIIDSNNQVIKDNTKRVKKSYQKTVGAKAPAPIAKSPIKSNIVEDLSPTEIDLFNDDDEDIVK